VDLQCAEETRSSDTIQTQRPTTPTTVFVTLKRFNFWEILEQLVFSQTSELRQSLIVTGIVVSKEAKKYK